MHADCIPVNPFHGYSGQFVFGSGTFAFVAYVLLCNEADLCVVAHPRINTCR